MKLLGKRLLAIGLTVALILLAVPALGAADALSFHLENSIIKDNTLYAVCNSSAEKGFLPGDITAKLGEQAITAEKVTSYADTALGASYLILADVSGSINAKTLEEMRSIIQGVVNSLNKNDTVSITPLAVTINCQPLTNNQETIASQLEAI
ncbi:MAG: hypothetical protein PHO41_06635, partial [Eubacteriales bacterium]|nr:hypothetical protein [Eubacteriales bacterium]